MNRHPWLNLLIRWAVLALGVALSAMLVPGITYDTTLTLVAYAVPEPGTWVLAAIGTFLVALLRGRSQVRR